MMYVRVKSETKPHRKIKKKGMIKIYIRRIIIKRKLAEQNDTSGN